MSVRLALSLAVFVSVPVLAQDDPVFRSLHQGFSSSGVGPYVGVGDLDGDQVPDVAFTTSSSVRLARGRGDGSFVLDPPQYVPGLGERDLALADLDLDGNLDLVTCGPIHEVMVALGHGDLSFAPAQTYLAEGVPPCVVVTEVNGDGLPDLVMGRQFGVRFDVLLGVGGGLFGPNQSFGPTALDPRVIAAGDFDGDGDIDVATGSGNANDIVILHNAGAGSFSEPLSVPVVQTVTAMAAGDLNEDGRDDLFFTGLSDLIVLLADPLGGFQPATTFTYSDSARTLKTADFDEDGHLDVAIHFGGEARIQRGHGDGSLEAPVVAPLAFSGFDLALGDLNVDGELDLVATHFNALTSELNRGDLSFGPGIATGDGPVGLALADFDGDGRLDLATADKAAHTVSVRLATGNGWFGALTTLPFAFAPRYLVSDDFNADGLPDLAAANDQAPYLVKVWLGAGDGSFGPAATYPVGEQLRDLASGDMNGDGLPELLVVSALHQELQLLLNEGNGLFVLEPSFPLAQGPNGMVLADLDEDGSLDVVTSHNLPAGSVQVHLNDGNGGISPAVPLSGGTIQTGLSCADIDGDGHLDLIGTDKAGVAAATRHGHGDGSFDAAVVLGTHVQAVGTIVGDVDADDVPDVIAWHTWQSPTGVFGLFRGLGAGAFAPEEFFEAYAAPMDVQLGDLDQDGVLDVASSISNQVQLLLSRRGPWDDLLQPLAGGAGFAHQTGEGTLVGGQHFSFTLSDARPSALCWHIVGLAALNANFKGGTMVPFPTLVNGPLLTNPQGKLVLAGNWPAGAPAGLSLYTQFWVQDPGGPVGFAASNALRATLP
jgi:hypothetical protein